VLGLEDSYLTPDPSRPSQFIDSLRSILIFEGGKVQAWLAYAESLQLLRESEMDSELVRVQAQLPNVARPTRDRWILVNVGILFLLSCVLRLLFPADVALIVKVYFDQSLLGQINKQENMFNS